MWEGAHQLPQPQDGGTSPVGTGDQMSEGRCLWVWLWWRM